MPVCAKKIFVACITLGLSTFAAAQHNTQEQEWLLLVSPFVWGASLKGDLAIAGKKADVDMPFADIVSDLDSVFMGNIELSNHRFGAYLDAINVDTSQTEHVMGQKIKVAVKQTTLAAGAFYRIYTSDLGGSTVFNEPRHFTIDPTIGVRWTKLKASLTNTALGLKFEKKTDWYDPFIGVRASADLDKHWNISALADVGGFDTSNKKTYNGQVYLGYRTFIAQQPTMLRVGYRYLSQRYKTRDFTGNSFNYDVRQAGPVLGLTVRF